jgi:hypothetical protein
MRKPRGQSKTGVGTKFTMAALDCPVTETGDSLRNKKGHGGRDKETLN